MIFMTADSIKSAMNFSGFLRATAGGYRCFPGLTKPKAQKR
jgi:hypothetical protein